MKGTLKPIQTLIAVVLVIAATLVAIAGTGFLVGIIWHAWQIGFRAGVSLL